mgnify:FL=1|jgi:hypothetical protein
MSHALSGRATISSTDNEDTLGVRVDHHGHVADHLMVDEFVSSGNVQNIVQEEAGTPPLVLADGDILEVRFTSEKRLSFHDGGDDLVSV